MKKKITRKVTEVERLYQMREEKIQSLEQKLRHSNSKMSSIQKLKNETKHLRERTEMEKMQRAFKDLVEAETEKQRTRKEREELRTVIKNRKNRSVLNKFAQAESIRMDRRKLRQSRVMSVYLQQMAVSLDREEKVGEVT